MNSYRLQDLSPGMREAFEVEVTAEMVDRFRDLSGDVNPLHIDAEFAKAAGYPDRVVYGMLTSAFYSTLVGVHLPGRHVLLHEVDASFVAPVFPGDKLSVSGEITEVHAELGQVEMRAEIRNGAGKRVSRAKIRMGLRE